MFGSGRTMGLVFMMVGVIMACGGTVGLLLIRFAYPPESSEQLSFWILMPLLIAVSLVSYGFLRYQSGQKTLHELETIQKQKQILHILKANGQVKIDDIAHNLSTSTHEISRLILDLVNQDLLHGYIDQQNNILYTKHKVVIQGATHCPHCGAEQTFQGKGVIKCRHCEAEILL